MSKKHHVDELDDLEDSEYELLGNQASKLGKEGHGKDRFRERRASDRQDYYAPAPKVKRYREKHD